MFEKCKLCKKELKTEISQERGYGPECWEKHLANKPKKSRYLLKPLIFPSFALTEIFPDLNADKFVVFNFFAYLMTCALSFFI